MHLDTRFGRVTAIIQTSSFLVKEGNVNIGRGGIRRGFGKYEHINQSGGYSQKRIKKRTKMEGLVLEIYRKP
jgi:hypothetical protein